MKTNAKNVLIGAAVIAAVVYYLYPTAFVREGFEGNFDTSPGGIFGLVIVGIFVIALLLAMVKGLVG